MKERFVIYISDNVLFLKDRKKAKIYQKQCQYLQNDEIIEKQRFYFEVVDFFHQNKIKIPLFGTKAQMIIRNDLREVEKMLYKEIFEDYFNNITFINITDCLPLKKSNALCNVSEHYLDYYYLKKNEPSFLRIDLQLFNNQETKAILYLFNNIFCPQKLILFGNNTQIFSIADYLNKETKIKIMYDENYNKYVLKEK